MEECLRDYPSLPKHISTKRSNTKKNNCNDVYFYLA